MHETWTRARACADGKGMSDVFLAKDLHHLYSTQPGVRSQNINSTLKKSIQVQSFNSSGRPIYCRQQEKTESKSPADCFQKEVGFTCSFTHLTHFSAPRHALSRRQLLPAPLFSARSTKTCLKSSLVCAVVSEGSLEGYTMLREYTRIGSGWSGGAGEASMVCPSVPPMSPRP